MKKKHFILPIIAIVFYLLVVTGFTIAENRLMEVQEKVAPFLKQAAEAPTKEARSQYLAVLDQESQKYHASLPPSFVRRFFVLGQQTIDAFTFAKPHCIIRIIPPCKTYTARFADNKMQSIKASIEKGAPYAGSAAKYTLFDHVLAIIILVIEAFVLSLLIGYAYEKRDTLKKVYSMNRFKVIMTIILFVVIIAPIMIYDDIYFAAPWIWFILAPPTIIDHLYGDAAYWITLIFMILWFYTIASIIDRVRKSR